MDDFDQQIDDRDNCVLRDDVPLDGDHDSAMTSIGCLAAEYAAEDRQPTAAVR